MKESYPLANDLDSLVGQKAQEKPDILARIEAYKRREIAVAKEQIAPAAMQKLARQTTRPREFVSAIALL